MLKTAVIYATIQGTTEKAANYIAEKLPEQDIQIFELTKTSEIDISPFDVIILGGSVYLGDIQPVMIEFCKDNLETLLTKRIGLFVCGIEPDLIRQDAELEMAFPRGLFNHAQATAFIGGEVNLEKLNASQKFISESLLKITESTSFLQYDLIDILIYQMELTSE
ncbi:MAG: flavodoxin domain-containing protein [Paludibacteraceae bacterium]